jgi:dephospho-CoA kinase
VSASAGGSGPALIGLTGGIAAGKSETLRILSELGAETLSTDAVVHELLGSDEVATVLIERWGGRVVHADGSLDRGRIAGIVFEDPDELGWLESVLHPRVGARVAEWREALPAGLDVAVVEVPLLFEGSMHELFDATIAVIADDVVRTERASARGTGQLEGRHSRQLPQHEKAARATFVVHNNGHIDELGAELRKLYPQLAAAGRS